MHLPEDLLHSAKCPGVDDTLAQLSDVAAAIIDADEVSIMLWKDGGVPADPSSLKPRVLDSGIRALPLQVDGLAIGEVHVDGPRGLAFDNPRLLAIFALFVGKSIQAAQLQAVLRSRFAQLALAQSAGKTLGDGVALSSQNPNRVARILAKSFYRELAGAGFSVQQIINAATEILSEVNASLKRHKKRQLREPASG
jgi:hypothetical protein